MKVNDGHLKEAQNLPRFEFLLCDTFTHILSKNTVMEKSYLIICKLQRGVHCSFSIANLHFNIWVENFLNSCDLPHGFAEVYDTQDLYQRMQLQGILALLVTLPVDWTDENNKRACEIHSLL